MITTNYDFTVKGINTEFKPSAVNEKIFKEVEEIPEVMKTAFERDLEEPPFDIKPDYSLEDAVMDLEAIKEFLYMITGMEYVPKNEFGLSVHTDVHV